MRLPLALPHPPAWEQQSISSQRQSWRAAGRLVASMQALTNQSDQVVQRMLDGNDFIEWVHYPDNDVRDQRHASQYFYHAHPGLQRPFSAPPEHGHFHLFADAGKLGMRPANPGYAPAPAHLLAISMDATGVPNGFFIVNRWVTKGPWLSYAHCARALQQFQIQGRQGDKHVNRFLQALITLYQAPILALLQQREQIMQTLSNGRDRRSVFADKSIEVLCYHPIQLMDDIAALEAVMQNNPH